MADLDPPHQLQRRSASGAWLAGGYLTQIRPAAGGDVTVDVDPGEVYVVSVRTGGHLAAALQREIRDDRQILDAYCAQAARQRAEHCPDLVRLRGADVGHAGRVDELLVLQLMIAAEQHQGRLTLDDLDQGLDLAVRGQAVSGSQVLDRPDTWRVQPDRCIRTRAVLDRGQRRGRLLQVRCVVAVRTRRNQVLARVG